MIYRKIKSFIGKMYVAIRLDKNILLFYKYKVSGIPIITIKKGGLINLDKNVYLKSNNSSYHLNMHSSVKLMADAPNAIIEIGENTRINGACVHAKDRITIGKNCLIAANTQIIDSSGHDLLMNNPSQRIHSKGKSKPVTIEDNVWIGANAIILPGVTIGEGSVVAAGSVVFNDVPKSCIVAGNPAQVVKQY